jgi:rhodanese-related sulfurtransferase
MQKHPAEVEEILARAALRVRESSLPCAGEVTPQEAYRLFSAHGAKIVDVRSAFEFAYIGRVRGTSLISWKFWPSGEINPNFLPELRRQCEPTDIVLFLCRSGIRSRSTAKVAAAAGFANAFNIIEGFEGDLDHHEQRGNTGGWRKAGLPWIQD